MQYAIKIINKIVMIIMYLHSKPSRRLWQVEPLGQVPVTQKSSSLQFFPL